MYIFLITFVALLLVVLMMSVGWIFSKKKISGSCGGIGALGMDKACDCEEVCDDHKLYQIEEPDSATK